MTLRSHSGASKDPSDVAVFSSPGSSSPMPSSAPRGTFGAIPKPPRCHSSEAARAEGPSHLLIFSRDPKPARAHASSSRRPAVPSVCPLAQITLRREAPSGSTPTSAGAPHARRTLPRPPLVATSRASPPSGAPLEPPSPSAQRRHLRSISGLQDTSGASPLGPASPPPDHLRPPGHLWSPPPLDPASPPPERHTLWSSATALGRHLRIQPDPPAKPPTGGPLGFTLHQAGAPPEDQSPPSHLPPPKQ